MVTVDYTHRFNYREVMEGHSPILAVTLSMGDESAEVDADAYLDSGASLSIFDGSFVRALGGQLINDRRRTFYSTAGSSVRAYLHPVRMPVPDLGVFELDAAFSDTPLSRNVLGRDFFNLVQIGFRDRYREFYINSQA